MIAPEEVKAKLEAAFPEALVTVEDTTGTQDHFAVDVTSTAFEGKTLIAQHRLVKSALQAEIDDGRIHAISIKTRIP